MDLPDGSVLTGIRDVFDQVADEQTSEQLRANMPQVERGTEFLYILDADGQVEAEWGIVVFDFANEQAALDAFHHLAEEVATVNKNPRAIRIEGAEDVPEIQAFLNSDLEYACLMNDIVIFPMGSRIVWVDDYTRESGAESGSYAQDSVRGQLKGCIRIASEIVNRARSSGTDATEEPSGESHVAGRDDDALTREETAPDHVVSADAEQATDVSCVIALSDLDAAWVNASLSSPNPQVGSTYILSVKIYPLGNWYLPHAAHAIIGTPFAPLCSSDLVCQVLVGYDEKMVLDDALGIEYKYADKDTVLVDIEPDDLGIFAAIAKDIRSIWFASNPETLDYILKEHICCQDHSTPPQSPYFTDRNAFDSYTIAWPPQRLADPLSAPGIHRPDWAEVSVPIEFEEPREYEIHIRTKCLLHPDPLDPVFPRGVARFGSCELALFVNVASPGATGADLAATSLSWDPTVPTSGDVVLFSCALRNDGDEAAVASAVSLSIDGEIVSTAQANPLQPGVSDELTFPETWRATPGTHQVTVKVDYHDDVAESNETNNELSKTLVVPDVASGPIGDALEWLRTQQHEDGAWDYEGLESVAITGLATLAFINAGYDADDPTVKAGLDYIVSEQDTSEGWLASPALAHRLIYETSIGLLPLVAARHVGYSPPPDSPNLDAVILDACQYLVDMQQVQDYGSEFYGGWRYPGPADRPADLSNSQWVLLALEAARSDPGLTAPQPDWNAAAVFIARCWNSNDNPYKHSDDGGFTYIPGDSSSWGSMTGAAVWSLALCGRNGVESIAISPGRTIALANALQSGMNWLLSNNSVSENPGKGTGWYYYYLITVAKAYLLMGENVGIDWYERMAERLFVVQKANGRFVSPDSDQESDTMATAQAVIALQTRAEAPQALQDTELWVLLASHADLHVYDSQGRHVGKNYETGGIDLGIPGATYRETATQAIGLPRPAPGRYQIELIGTGAGSYELTVESRRKGVPVVSERFSGTIAPYERQAATATLSSIVGPATLLVGRPLPTPGVPHALPGGDEIAVWWPDYSAPGFHLAGYNVYRSTRSGRGHTRINTGLVVSNEFTDAAGIDAWKTYYYVVTAVDQAGSETGFSPEGSGMCVPQSLIDLVLAILQGFWNALLSLFGL